MCGGGVWGGRVLEDAGRPNGSSAHVDAGESFTASQGVGTTEKTSFPAVGILTVFPDCRTSSYVTWFGPVPRQGEGKQGGGGHTAPPAIPTVSTGL